MSTLTPSEAVDARLTHLETLVQQQAQVNFRYEIIIRALVDVLATKSVVVLDEVNKRAEDIKTELIAQARAATAAASAEVAATVEPVVDVPAS